MASIKMGIDISNPKGMNKTLKEFFSNFEIQDLLEENQFDIIYERWGEKHNNANLTALFLLSGINFLPYLSSLPKYCFYGLSKLIKENRPDLISGFEYFIIPSNINSIGESSLNINLIKNIDLNKVKKLTKYSLAGVNIKEINTKNVESIESLSFYMCPRLNKITISSNLKRIDTDEYCFNYNANLKIIEYEGTKEEFIKKGGLEKYYVEGGNFIPVTFKK